MKNEYTKPTLNKTKPKGWYIGYTWNGISIRKKYGYNRIKDLAEREHKYNVMIKTLEINLDAGYDPTKPHIKEPEEKCMTLIESLDFAMEKKKGRVSESTMYLYGCTLKFIKKAIKTLRKDSMNADTLTRKDVLLILDETVKQQKASNKSYNKYLNHFKAILGTLHKWEVIPYNPASKIDYMPQNESRLHEPPTKEQLTTIVNKLRNDHPLFWNFIELYYYSGRRPHEVLKFKRSDISLEYDNELIIIKPENAKNTGKIKRYQYVAITPEIFAVLLRTQIFNHPDNYYLFGKNDIANHLRYKRGGDYIPSESKMRMQAVVSLWRRIVKEELGLNVTMYSFKKLAANHELLSGVGIHAVSEFLGHEGIKATKTCATKLQQVNRNEIVKKSKPIDDFM